MLTLDEADYRSDDDLMYMLHRLTAAAANAEMRQDMNVEDEYYQVIEDRDTEILMQKKKLKEQRAELKQKDKQLTQKDAEITQKDAELTQKDAELTQKDEQLTQKDEQIRNLVRTMSLSGIAIESIASALNITEEEAKGLLTKQ